MLSEVNLNYKAKVKPERVAHLPFRMQPPQMCSIQHEAGTIVIFRSGKCRIMGCNSFPVNLPFKIKVRRLQSATLVINYGTRLKLSELHNRLTSRHSLYEPELFPALRLMDFNPLCVNVFSSGKIVILGLRKLNYKHLIKRIFAQIEHEATPKLSQISATANERSSEAGKPTEAYATASEAARGETEDNTTTTTTGQRY